MFFKANMIPRSNVDDKVFILDCL